jgi:hypothetical protein
MARQRAGLAAIRDKVGDLDPYRLAFAAGIAVRTVGEDAAATKPGADQFTVGRGVDQVRRCGDLGARDAARQVGAAIRRRRIELQQRKWRQVAQVGHRRPRKYPSMASTAHLPGGSPTGQSASRRATKSRREIGRAPSEARCRVSIWQSIMPNPRCLRCAHKCASAILDASRCRENIDSP